MPIYNSCYVFRALYSIPTRRSSDLIADHDLAVEEHPLGEARIAKLGDRRQEIARGPVGELETRTIAAEQRPDLIPFQLEQVRSEEHTSELQSPDHIVCRLLLEKHIA